MATLSKTQIDRLGDRLRRGVFPISDLHLLDEYRKSFGSAYDFVISTIKDTLGLEPTGRPAKSTTSILEKLRREKIRLSQVQDIAGCRLVVSDIIAEERIHGYRAVQVIVTAKNLSVEIQVRSDLQHIWAEVSERLADVVDSDIKYGGGEEKERELLTFASKHIANLEEIEKDLYRMYGETINEQNPETQQFQSKITQMKNVIAEAFREYVSRIDDQKR